MLGTKCPSMTSRWIQSAPAASTARTSSPSLAKSEARIDGAMTRGRDMNCWDMCAFPKASFDACERVSRNTRKARGQCGQTDVARPENSAVGGINCRAEQAFPKQKKSIFIGFFAMARRLLIVCAKVRSRVMRHCRSARYAVGFWPRVVPAGRLPVADHAEIAVSANRRPQPEPDQPVRHRKQLRACGKLDSGCQ